MKLKRMLNVLAPNQIVVICKEKSEFTDEIFYHGVAFNIPEGLMEEKVWLVLPISFNEIKIYVDKCFTWNT